MVNYYFIHIKSSGARLDFISQTDCRQLYFIYFSIVKLHSLIVVLKT
jgi:hypothetical protein